MKCPYCAEEIRDEAILCRFCGAAKVNEEWQPPARPPARKGSFTIRTAAVFFLISAFLEALSLTSTVPLFGAVRGGAVALSYHLVYTGLFVAMGIGLWSAKPWGFDVMLAGTIFYTLDKVIYMLDSRAREAYLAQQMQGFGDILGAFDQRSIVLTLNITTLLFIACWWGFMSYLYRHRSYFEAPQRATTHKF